jgi:hypothetical protein
MVNRCIAIERERLGWEDCQCTKKRWADQQIHDHPFQRTRNAPPPLSRNNFRSGSNPPNQNFGGSNNQPSYNMGPTQGGEGYNRFQQGQ